MDVDDQVEHKRARDGADSSSEERVQQQPVGRGYRGVVWGVCVQGGDLWVRVLAHSRDCAQRPLHGLVLQANTPSVAVRLTLLSSLQALLPTAADTRLHVPNQ